jgi:hypothetical protein
MSAVHAPAFHIAGTHAHTATDRCPWCDQAVPHEKFAEIRSRIAAKEREQHAEVTNRLKEEFAREKMETEARAREEGRKAAEAAIEARLATAEAARTAAEAARTAAETALQAEREALEKAKTVAVLAEQAKAFEERQKLQEKVLGLQKQLENKTAQELGEGPEVDLFEQLKAAFEGDRLRRVLKGAQGADVIHEVVHKGQVCGKIIYDSKNRNAWKSDFVTKLRADQLAERAEHAVLSSNKFPAGTQQLHIQDGVIIASPGRVVAVAELLRRHILQTHELRISNDAREEKTAALYAFITSDRCKQLLEQIETQMSRMLELEAAEEKAHRVTWERRSKLIHHARKVHGGLCFEIERVIGTGESADHPAEDV